MSQQQFFALLKPHTRIAHLWSEEKAELDVDQFEKELGVLSTSEAHLARFFAAVWAGSDRRFPFDFVGAMSRLDARGQKTIASWAAAPFWP